MASLRTLFSRRLGKCRPSIVILLPATFFCCYVWLTRPQAAPNSAGIHKYNIISAHQLESVKNTLVQLAKAQKYTTTNEVKKNNTKHIAHGNYDLHTIPRWMSCQSAADDHSIVWSIPDDSSMTVRKCIKYCIKKATTYAALTNGSRCLCTNSHGTNYLEPSTECNVTCSGDDHSFCGGIDRWMFYKVADADGARGWTIWMSYGNTLAVKNRLRTRYIGCVGDNFEKRSCVVKMEISLKPNSPGELTAVGDYFIGCFSQQTWQLTALHFVLSNVSNNITRTSLDCVGYCQGTQSLYAIMSGGRCLCTNSLGWSRPIDTCYNSYGALVLSTTSIKHSKVHLNFEERLTQRNVAVVAHYRAGSTFSSLMFSEHPQGLYVFEPASIFHLVWKGINNSLAREHVRSRDFVDQVYPYWFECMASDLPGIWLKRYPSWGERNRGLDEYKKCRYAARHRILWEPSVCSGVIEEKCLMSTIVAAKTTRIINADNLRSFIGLSPNIDFIHVIRDPRGTLSSRRQLEKFYRSDYESHLQISCWELNRLSELFNGSNSTSNLHSLHYEDLVTSGLEVVTHMYRKLGLALPNEVVQNIKTAAGNVSDTPAVRKNAYDIKQSKPGSRINRWIGTLPAAAVHKGDNTSECRLFHKTFSAHYKPLSDMRV